MTTRKKATKKPAAKKAPAKTRPLAYTKADSVVLDNLLTTARVEVFFQTSQRNVLFTIERGKLPFIQPGRDKLVLRKHCAAIWKERVE